MFGAWLNFVLAFFAYDKLHALLFAIFGADSGFTSPFWVVLEGAIVGFIIGYFATRFGGEGKETVTVLPDHASWLSTGSYLRTRTASATTVSVH